MEKSAAAIYAAALFFVDSYCASSVLGQCAYVRGDLQHQKLGRGAQLEQVAVVDGNLLVFIIGGAQIYAEALPRAGRFYLTRVFHDYEGDTCFPAWNEAEWRLTSSESFPHGKDYPWPFAFENWERR